MKNLTLTLGLLCVFLSNEASMPFLSPSPSVGGSVAVVLPHVISPESFSGGTGTKSDPYRVTTATQLSEVRSFPHAHFIQMADIDLGVSPWNSGKGWVPSGRRAETAFSGSFDGNGFKILNLTINMPDSSFVGLFGCVAAADIKNVSLENVSVKGKDFVGALAGQALGGNFSVLQVTGTVTETGEYAGGLFGMVNGVSIKESHSEAIVTGHRFVGGLAGSGMADGCNASGKITGLAAGEEESSSIGGLLGQGSAINSYATGEVSGGSEVGGLIGSGTAKGCYATGNVTATGDYAGGLIGDLVPIGDDQGTEQEYTPGMAALPDTITKSKSITSINGQPTIIFLEDSTRVLVPAFPAPLKITLVKKGFDISPDDIFPPGSNFRPTGSMRQLTIRGTGDALAVKPVITIPAGEAGTINMETINAVRVGTMYVNGELVKNYTAVLPVFKDENGNFKFVDALFPDGVTPDSLKSATIDGGGDRTDTGVRQITETAWVGNVRYFLMTFDKSLNWSKRPVLERMVPDSTLSSDGYRKPWRQVSPTEREKVTKQPICNIVILVHGHNEEEKDGYLAGRIASPWEFTYKRLLWDLLYEDISKNRDKQFPSGCTALYEFIAPTYRPIFSPVGSKSGFPHQTLGEDLGNMINEEMENNAQIKAMMDDNVPFNLFLVAHSQGGLVARAGLRFVKPEILKRLKLVVTWGSPHTGAALYSLRYALTVGHDMVIDGVRLPLQNIGQSEAYQSGVSAIAMDAPGIRDLRWDASKADMLRFGELFKENTTTLNEFPDTELPNGKMFFSENLKLFNESEGNFSGNLLKDRYKFYEGTTSKNASLELGWDYWTLKRLYYFGKQATGIEKGAQLNKLAMKATWNASDGAVPTYSQRGTSIWPAGNILSRNMGDTDHEEYYGGENPNRNATSLSKGKNVLSSTFSDMEMSGESRSCPKLELTSKTVGDTLVISGSLIYPQIKKANGGDDMPGKRIVLMSARRDNEKGPAVPVLLFKWKDDGTFEGKGKKADIPDDTLFIAATLKDKSVVSEILEPKIENKVFNKRSKAWYTTIQKAVDEAIAKDTIVVYPGIYPEYVTIAKNIIIESKSGPATTILEGSYSGFGIIDCSPVIKGFTVRKSYQGVFIRETTLVNLIKPVIENNFFIENESKGIMINGKAAPQILNNVFSNNVYFGIQWDRYGTVKVDVATLISGNKFTGGGRGMQIQGDVLVDIIGNTISNTEDGIEVLGKASVTITKDTLIGNIYSGIRLYLGTNPTVISGCLLKQNGVAISVLSDAKFNITGNSILDNNTGIHFEWNTSQAGELVVSNNTISGSLKNPDYSEGGDGIYIQSAKVVTITGNTLSNNKAWGGGGIHINSATTADIKGNTITGNSSSSYGGGIYIGYGTNITIKQNTISKNTAGVYGGGIFTSNSANTAIEGNVIKDNYATEYGGGICGTVNGWPKNAVVTVNGKAETVTRYVPCFTETTNTFSGNSHGKKLGAWGPGIDKWCDDSGYDFYPY